jgi:hypothetical protein
MTPTYTATKTPTKTFSGIYYFSGRSCCTGTLLNIGLYDLTQIQYNGLAIGQVVTITASGGIYSQGNFCFEILGPAGGDPAAITWFTMIGNSTDGCLKCTGNTTTIDCCCAANIDNITLENTIFGETSTIKVYDVYFNVPDCADCCKINVLVSTNINGPYTSLIPLNAPDCNSPLTVWVNDSVIPTNATDVFFKLQRFCCVFDGRNTNCNTCTQTSTIGPPEQYTPNPYAIFKSCADCSSSLNPDEDPNYTDSNYLSLELPYLNPTLLTQRYIYYRGSCYVFYSWNIILQGSLL